MPNPNKLTFYEGLQAKASRLGDMAFDISYSAEHLFKQIQVPVKNDHLAAAFSLALGAITLGHIIESIS